MSQDVTPADLTPSHGLPARPRRSHPDVPASVVVRQRVGGTCTVGPDAIEFDAPCPACGITAQWTEARVDTRVEITIGCRICDRRDRRHLPLSA